MNQELLAYMDHAAVAARRAGELLRQRPTEVRHKGAIDLVTEIDLASERCIREMLAPLGIPVQGEEGGGDDSGDRWVVDPLDGTTNFVHGYPHYCVSIALVHGGGPVVGVIYDPVRDQLYEGAAGCGARRNGEVLAVSDTRTLDEALCVTGFPYDRRDHAHVYLAYVDRVLRHTQGMRRSGSAAMDMVTLAAGQVDIFWEFGLKAWDTAAGQLLVVEAGGIVSRLSGTPHRPGAPSVLATNPWLHDAVVALFADLASGDRSA
ncbi:MAG: inositol monophosphatase [Myxococcales bacterium]|nr:inositol monophosphatase [Myxococcales bacterium]